MMEERIIFTIKCFSEENWAEPCANWPDYWFNKSSYSRWAISEIIELLENRGINESPKKVVSNFISRMDRYSCLNDSARKIFSIARETADDVLDFLHAME